MNKEYVIPKNHDVNFYGGFYKEIWVENEYNRFDVCVRDGDVVFDCGANIGLFTNYALVRGATKVISIEYLEEIYNCLVKNIDQPNKVTAINGAVTDMYGVVENINHYNFDRLISENNIDKIDFAKVDIEGWEYPLLLNMSDETMQKVDRWAIELHNIYDDDEKNKILKILEKFSLNGFVCNYEQIHKNYNIAMLYVKKKG
jgi:tRNA G37 N-methylase Trm5